MELQAEPLIDPLATTAPARRPRARERRHEPRVGPCDRISVRPLTGAARKFVTSNLDEKLDQAESNLVE